MRMCRGVVEKLVAFEAESRTRVEAETLMGWLTTEVDNWVEGAIAHTELIELDLGTAALIC